MQTLGWILFVPAVAAVILMMLAQSRQIDSVAAYRGHVYIVGGVVAAGGLAFIWLGHQVC